jgi:pilus assembly protein CpaF
MSISEITGMEGEVIQMQDIYRFIKEHTDEQGTHGTFRATGVRPSFLQELQAFGIEIPSGHFETSQPV